VDAWPEGGRRAGCFEIAILQHSKRWGVSRWRAARYAFVLSIAIASVGCGFGFGGIYGPKRYPAGTIRTFTADDPTCRYNCRGWARWFPYKAFSVNRGLMTGFRRGVSWARLGEASLDGGRSADFHLTGYLSFFSLGAGYTTESGTITSAAGGTSTAGYKGLFIEPGIGVPIGPLYLGGMLAVIDGTTHQKLDGNISTNEADARGLRPGARAALGLFKVNIVTFKLTADFRYLITPDVMLFSGAGSTPTSFGGWSSVFSVIGMM